MTDLEQLGPIESLVLVRLLPALEKGDTVDKMKKDLEPMLGHRWSGSILSDLLERTLTSLESKGLVTHIPPKSKKKPPTYILTAIGSRRGLDLLGVERLMPKSTWAVIKKTYLPACALGLTGLSDTSLKSFSKDLGFKAALLTRSYKLPLGESPTLAQAIDALAWTLLGIESSEKFTVSAVQKALFHRALGDPPARPAEAKKAIDLLLARRIGARRNEAKEFRDAVLRGWVDRSLDGQGEAMPDPSVSGPSTEAEPGPAPSPVPFDLHRFAEKTLAAARSCTTGRFGTDKVFIIHVWQALQKALMFPEMNLAEFKRRLAEANNARLLDLSRADLVSAMDPDDVRLSELTYMNATFHFIRTGSER
jgi:hypothetical protein